MNSLPKLIDEIRLRPAAYITKNYISCLKSFIDGWCLRNPTKIEGLDLLGDFQEWIADKYSVTTSHSWCDIILFYSQDESTAMDKFFIEYDNFLVSRLDKE